MPMDATPTRHELEERIALLEKSARKAEELRKELQKSEVQYRQLAETAHDIIATVDLDFRITYGNRAILNYTGGMDVTGMSLLDFTPPEFHSLQKEIMKRMREGFDELLAFQWELRSPGGRAVIFDIRASLLKEEGKPFSVLFIARDITERKQSEADRKESEKRYRTIFESTATANVSIAEDTPIIMASDDFADWSGYSKEELEEKIIWTRFVHPDDLETMKRYHAVRRIDSTSAPSSYEFRFVSRDGTERDTFISVALIPGTRDSIASLIDLTRQVLAFARKQPVSPRVLDLNDTVTGMLKMLRRLIGEDVDLGWHAGHNLWKVKIDPSQVDQLLANLTVNARDSIEKTGSIIIETSNELCDGKYWKNLDEGIPGEYVMLSVRDDGCGIPPEELPRIFEPFFTTKKRRSGNRARVGDGVRHCQAEWRIYQCQQ